MAKRLLLRDAENVSGDQLQRILGMELFPAAAVAGVGTGYAAGVIGKLTGVATTGHLAVTADGVDRILTILPGWAAVIRDAGGSSYDPRAFFAESDANDSSVTLTANATGSTRNDTVCLRVDQNTAPTSDGSNLVSFVAIAGQAGGGLSNAPADGNLYLPLANVAVANGAAFVASGNVTDLRTGVLDFASELRLTPPGGAASKMPAGTLLNGYQKITANQAGVGNLVDITGLAVTVTVGAGRRIRINAKVIYVKHTAGTLALDLFEGATQLDQWVITAIDTNTYTATLSTILQPSAGSHPSKLTVGVSAGTADVQGSATAPSYIHAEDIGA